MSFKAKNYEYYFGAHHPRKQKSRGSDIATFPQGGSACGTRQDSPRNSHRSITGGSIIKVALNDVLIHDLVEAGANDTSKEWDTDDVQVIRNDYLHNDGAKIRAEEALASLRCEQKGAKQYWPYQSVCIILNMSRHLGMLETTKSCPNCDQEIEKNEGCLHMMCTNCQFNFW